MFIVQCKTSNLASRNRKNPTEHCSPTMLTIALATVFFFWKYETQSANNLEKLEYLLSTWEFVFFNNQTWLFPTSVCCL